MANNLLTDAALKRAAPQQKPYRPSDGAGLYIIVRPEGAMWWRMDYRFQGKDKTLSLGVYPAVTLKRARERAAEIREQVLDGVDPSAVRKAKAAGVVSDSFEAIAREWHTRRTPTLSNNTATNLIKRLEANAFPIIGQRSVRELKAPDVSAPTLRYQ